MAHKTPTFTEPTAVDVALITLTLTDGQVTEIEASISVQSSDPATRYRPSPTSRLSDPDTYSQTVKDGLALIASETAAKFSAAEGF